MNKIKIGWAEADITPENKVELYGQYYQRISKGIHSRLGGSVLALESDNGEQGIMISVDSAFLSSKFLNELRDNLKDKLTTLDVSKIIMNAIHTHSAPALDLAFAIHTDIGNSFISAIDARTHKRLAKDLSTISRGKKCS